KKQTQKEDILDVNDLISEFSATIGRVLGDNFDLKIVKKKTGINLLMNEVSFEQILINLLVNARDAMPYGGIVQVTTDIINLDKNIFENGHYATKGKYLEMSISDSGIGISMENIKKIFDPFFTTKKEKGNGFGLSTVNSIVKQKGGFIKVSSKVGVGTTFFIYLPIYEKDFQETIIANKLISGPKKILFCEDEISILLPIIKGLKIKGFDIEGANDGFEALEKAKKIPKIDILITDISIPKINGIDLYKELKKINPDIYVIFTSGYSNEKVDFEDNKKVLFLQKPYSLKDLYNYVLKCQ
ncbi:MAG: ATP-binding protein, partial [Bacteroidota bacterium]